MQDKIKIAVWGVGRHARKRILPAIKDAETVELIGLCTRNQAVGKEEAGRKGCLYYSSIKKMLSDTSINAVYLCTPTGLHFSQGQSVLQAGKHLWCEKALTTSYTHSQQLIKTAIDKNLFAGEAYMYKYHQQFKILKTTVKDMQFGRLKRLICRFSIPALDQPGFRVSHSLGASALLDVGSYTFSIASELLGDNLSIELAEHKMDANAIDQSGFCILSSEDGGKAILDWSYDSCYINQVELWFQKGAIFTDKIFSKPDNYKPVLKVRAINGNFENQELMAENCYVNMLNYFARCSTEPSIDHYNATLYTSQLLSAFVKKTGMSEIAWK